MRPTSVEELQDVIRTQRQILPAGAGSKTALGTTEKQVVSVSAAGLRGIVEYEPNEYTFTTLAGTPVAEVEQVLAENNQYLPFDPPLSGAGATLGGTVAAGLSGAGRYRYGGVRDALLGVRFLDGQGNLVRGGGRVVKNSAGFDLPKFLVGSLGGYGYLVELTFKVMPQPEAFATLCAHYPTLEAGLNALVGLTHQPYEIYALELLQKDRLAEVLVRVGGAANSLAARLERVGASLGEVRLEMMEGAEELALWQSMRDFNWLPAGYNLVKIPLTPKRVQTLEKELASSSAQRIYSAGANLAWVAWPGEIGPLEAILEKLGLSGLVVLGKTGKVRLGVRSGESFALRIKQALDPDGKYAIL